MCFCAQPPKPKDAFPIAMPARKGLCCGFLAQLAYSHNMSQYGSRFREAKGFAPKSIQLVPLDPKPKSRKADRIWTYFR